MPKKEISEKDEEKEESELEELLENSEKEDEENSDDEETEEKSEDKSDVKKEKKKLRDIIPEFRERNPNRNNFQNFMNSRSSVTLDKRMVLEEVPTNLEQDLEQTTQKPKDADSEDNKKSDFEYIAKASDKEKQQGVYQHYENATGVKSKKAEDVAKSWGSEFENRKGFREIYDANAAPKPDTEYQIRVKSKDFKEIDRKNPDKDFNFQESKMEYYSHK